MNDEVIRAMERAAQRQHNRNEALDRIGRHISCNIALAALNFILLLIILIRLFSR